MSRNGSEHVSVTLPKRLSMESNVAKRIMYQSYYTLEDYIRKMILRLNGQLHVQSHFMDDVSDCGPVTNHMIKNHYQSILNGFLADVVKAELRAFDKKEDILPFVLLIPQNVVRQFVELFKTGMNEMDKQQTSKDISMALEQCHQMNLTSSSEVGGEVMCKLCGKPLGGCFGCSGADGVQPDRTPTPGYGVEVACWQLPQLQTVIGKVESFEESEAAAGVYTTFAGGEIIEEEVWDEDRGLETITAGVDVLQDKTIGHIVTPTKIVDVYKQNENGDYDYWEDTSQKKQEYIGQWPNDPPEYDG